MPAFRPRLVFMLLLVSWHHPSMTALADDGDYGAEIERFREKRVAELKSEDGWLSVVGLHWLSPGKLRIGSDPTADILLPASAPADVGTIEIRGESAFFEAASGAKVMRSGVPFSGGEVRSDATGKPDVLSVGKIRMLLLRRGRRYALRVKDPDSEARRNFKGLRWFPVDPNWRIPARFVPAPEKTRLVFDTIVGEQEVAESPGHVILRHDGKEYRLQAASEADGSLWIVFRDGTSGRTTAGGARQLTTSRTSTGELVLDFNKATNLPCAYIPFATCPLAPPQNRLPFPITAGEQKYEANASRP